MEDYIILTAHIFPDKQQKAEILKADYNDFAHTVSKLSAQVIVYQSEEDIAFFCKKMEIKPILKKEDFGYTSFLRKQYSFDANCAKKLKGVLRFISEVLGITEHDFLPIKWERYISAICSTLDYEEGSYKPVFYFTEESRDILRIL